MFALFSFTECLYEMIYLFYKSIQVFIAQEFNKKSAFIFAQDFFNNISILINDFRELFLIKKSNYIFPIQSFNFIKNTRKLFYNFCNPIYFFRGLFIVPLPKRWFSSSYPDKILYSKPIFFVGLILLM